jgi:hypothetical protein
MFDSLLRESPPCGSTAAVMTVGTAGEVCSWQTFCGNGRRRFVLECVLFTGGVFIIRSSDLYTQFFKSCDRFDV